MPRPILLVENDLVDAQIVLRALAELPQSPEVVHVSDGAEALDFLLRQGRFADRNPGVPSMIFLELQLPRIDGSELLKLIRRDPQFADVPIVMVSASLDQQDIVGSLANGANDYVVKLAEISHFIRELKAAGSRWAWPDRSPSGPVPSAREKIR